MAQTIKIKRSNESGKTPQVGDMEAGELAMNTADGKFYLRDTSLVRPIVTVNNQVTGSINLIGNITASGDISASGNLFANLSENSNNYNTVVYNSTTGQFFYTGSYGGGDNLGNHTATIDLNMGGNDITNVGNVDGVDVSSLNSSVNILEILVAGNIGNITELVASASSALVTASAVDNVITFEKGDGTTFPVTIDTGSGLTVGGIAGAIQYSDGAGNLDFSNNWLIDTANNATHLGGAIRFKTDTNLPTPVDNISNNLSLRHRGLTFSQQSDFTGSFANFESKRGHLMLYPQTELYGGYPFNDLEYVGNLGLIASSRFHVIDDAKQHVAKIINLDANIYGGEGASGAAALLIGTRNYGCQSQLAAPFTFIDFQVGCGVHQGESIGGIYYDPCGTAFASNANSVVYQGFFYQGSDKKLKKHITDTKRGIDDIMSMKVKDYRWKGNSRTSTKSVGLIAQDLQETHPELVTTLNDTLNVNYTGIVPMLIKAIQDQQEQIDDLKKQLENR